MEVDKIQGILNEILDDYEIYQLSEVSMEANPDTLSYEMLKQLKNIGIQRISIGVQSFDEKVLRILDRKHSSENVYNAVGWAKELDLKISIDLIYGTPGESIFSWERTLKEAVRLNPNHISCYSLTIEPHTKMFTDLNKGVIKNISQDDQAEKYETADRVLSQAGYEWYEISNWAKKDGHAENKSLHNLAYWTGVDYIGFGPSAHSYLDGIRFANNKNINNWKVDFSETIDTETRNFEQIMLNTRLNKPIESSQYNLAIINKLENEGYIDGNSHRLTLKGRLLNDQVVYILDGQQNINAHSDSNSVCQYFQTSHCRACPVCTVLN